MSSFKPYSRVNQQLLGRFNSSKECNILVDSNGAQDSWVSSFIMFEAARI